MQTKRFPLSSWACGDATRAPEEQVREWAEIGLTLIMTPTVTDDPRTHAHVRRMLDLCAENGIEAMVLDNRVATPGGNWRNPPEVRTLPADYRERAAEAVKEFGKHPAVWGFHVTDEPLCGNVPAVAQACRTLGELTDRVPYVNYLPNHIIDDDGGFGTIREQTGFQDFGAYLDHVVQETGTKLLSYDQYCSMSEEWGGPDHYYRCLADYQGAAIRHGIDFWNIILAHGHWMYKAPTPLQMSWQFYSSLAYGAQGIIYFQYRGGWNFGYGAPIDELGNRGPLFHQLQRQHHQFLTQWAPRYRDCRPVSTQHWPNAPAGLKRFDGTGIVESLVESPMTTRLPSPPSHLLVGEFRDSRGRPHVLLANGSAEKHTEAIVTVKGKAIHAIVGGDGEQPVGKSLPDGRACLRDFIMPGQALFFRVET